MTEPISHPPAAPIVDHAKWSQELARIAATPLEFCEDFARIARRHEAWWEHGVLDRPVFMARANTKPDRPIGRRLELLGDVNAWFETKFEDMRQLLHVGDTLPSIRTDFGPVFLGGLLGAELEFSSDTAWTHASIDDTWSNAPDWSLSEDNRWWRLLCELTQRVARDAAGRYLLCTPDLGGSADVLLNLRGSQPLCMDVIGQPERIRKAIDAIYPAWYRAFTEIYRTTLGYGAGLIHWLGIWSNQPYMIPACDFNALIGPKQFRELCLPDIVRQAATVGRALFHLDGPDAARHCDALLEVPQIDAIQFTPGAGTPSALARVEMLQQIQDRGRSLLIICPANEVLDLCAVLRPEGLAILVEDSLPPAELEQLFGAFSSLY